MADFLGMMKQAAQLQTKMQELQADEWSFELWQFGVPEFQPK